MKFRATTLLPRPVAPRFIVGALSRSAKNARFIAYPYHIYIRRQIIIPDHDHKILSIRENIAWLPQPNECRTVLSSQLPPLEQVKTALALVFMGNHLLMTNLASRGWDIPGGHTEPGEHPEEAVRREVFEETGAELGPLYLLAHQRLRLLGPKPDAYRYPFPDSYQVFYTAQVSSLNDFSPTAEALGRFLFPPSVARTLAWVQINRELYEAALQRVK